MHPCYKCPLIQDQIEKGIEKIDRDESISLYLEEEIIGYLCRNSYCPKIGTNRLWHGLGENMNCDGEYGNFDSSIHYNKTYRKNRKRRREYRRECNQKYKNHLRELSKVSGYPSPAWYVGLNKDGKKSYYEEDSVKGYYERFYFNHGGSYKRYLKKCSNKAVRRYKDDISNGNGYRKIFEYQWKLS